MTFLDALERVYISPRKLKTAHASLPGDAIGFDMITGWHWCKSGAPVSGLPAPLVLFSDWVLLERDDEDAGRG